MIHLDFTSFGSITINGKRYGQVLIVGETVQEREEKKLYSLFGTTHYIGNWEVEKLLSNKPEVIIIGSGQSGVLEVTDDVRQKLIAEGAKLKILITPEAIKEYNKLVAEGKKVNALIHTTC